MLYFRPKLSVSFDLHLWNYRLIIFIFVVLLCSSVLKYSLWDFTFKHFLTEFILHLLSLLRSTNFAEEQIYFSFVNSSLSI